MSRVCKLWLLVLVGSASAVVACSADGAGYDNPDDAPYDDSDTTCQVTGHCDDDDSGTFVENRDTFIVALTSGQDRPICITVDDDTAYWVRKDGTIGAISTRNMPSFGTPTPQYARTRVDFDGNAVCGILRDGNYLYVTSIADNSILRYTITKNPDFTVSFTESTDLLGFTTPTSIAADDGYIYVTEANTATIHRFSKPDAADGGAADAGTADGGLGDVFPAEGLAGSDLLVDRTSLYWTSTKNDVSAIRKMPKTGGSVEVVSEHQPGAFYEIGDALYFQCGTQLCTRPTSGGLTAVVAIPGVTVDSGVSSPEVHGFVPYGTDIYIADGESIDRLNGLETKVFGYADSPVDVQLFAQKNRLVWSDGTYLYTRGVTQP